ncbi:MAG TPA: hypothetical protein VII33_06630 [Nakamurella sp.]
MPHDQIIVVPPTQRGSDRAVAIGPVPADEYNRRRGGADNGDRMNADTERCPARWAPTGGPGRRHRMRCVAVSAMVAALAIALAGCSSSTSTSTGTTPSASSTSPASSGTPSSYPTGKEQLCQARDQLKTSLASLTNPSLLQQGTVVIKAAVDQVQTDLNAVVAAGTQDYQPQVTALQSALQQLQSATGNLGNGNVSQNLQAVGTAIAATGTAAADLFGQLQATCGS